VIVAVVLALLQAACGGQGDSSKVNGNIRFVHVSTETDPVNISYDSTTVVSSLGYHGASTYQALDYGSHEIKVQSAASGAVYSDAQMTVVPAAFYTYLLYGGGSSMVTLVLADAVSDAASGKFNLRAVNVATGIGSVDIYLLSVGSTIDQVAPTFSGVTYGGTAAFTQFATGDYDLVVARAGSKDVIYEMGKQTMAANAKVTLLVYATGSGKLANGALLYNDTSGTTTFIDGLLARFKFVNAATDLGSVDLLVDGTAALANVPYGLLSAYNGIAAGSRNFKIQASSAPGAYVYNQNKTLGSGTDNSLVAYSVQGTGNAGLIALADNNLPPVSGKAKLRLVNASSDTTAYDAYVNFAKLLSGLAQGTASAYQQLDPGTYTVTFTPAATTTQAASVTLQLDAGHVYTVYTYGRVSSLAAVTTTDY
jgi:hypothetical protein